jgi:glycosyltransferase involved in cell wall biosynthesis
MDSWFSNVYPDMNKNWYKKYYSFNYALENSDVIDFLSPFIYQGVVERGLKIDLNNVSICPCSFVDYSNCKSGNKEDFEIAFASRLELDKNPLIFLKAAQIVLDKHANVKFHLLGEGSLKDEVLDFISTNKLSSKINYQFHKNPPEIFAETSVFVSIQTTNNYPSQSVLEAMACGNAIIASDVGDTKMFVNEKNGILINLDLDSLVSALENLIKNPTKTKELGNNAKKFVKINHNVEKAEKYYKDLFQKAYDKVFI